MLIYKVQIGSYKVSRQSTGATFEKYESKCTSCFESFHVSSFSKSQIQSGKLFTQTFPLPLVIVIDESMSARYA